ncbi:unnamed protein product [Ectocarpus sp. 13 AM-2016]
MSTSASVLTANIADTLQLLLTVVIVPPPSSPPTLSSDAALVLLSPSSSSRSNSSSSSSSSSSMDVTATAAAAAAAAATAAAAAAAAAAFDAPPQRAFFEFRGDPALPVVFRRLLLFPAPPLRHRVAVGRAAGLPPSPSELSDSDPASPRASASSSSSSSGHGPRPVTLAKVSWSNPSSSSWVTKRPFRRGLLSASFFRQSYLIFFLQMRRPRLAWNLATRAARSSRVYAPTRYGAPPFPRRPAPPPYRRLSTRPSSAARATVSTPPTCLRRGGRAPAVPDPRPSPAASALALPPPPPDLLRPGVAVVGAAAAVAAAALAALGRMLRDRVLPRVRVGCCCCCGGGVGSHCLFAEQDSLSSKDGGRVRLLGPMAPPPPPPPRLNGDGGAGRG